MSELQGLHDAAEVPSPEDGVRELGDDAWVSVTVRIAGRIHHGNATAVHDTTNDGRALYVHLWPGLPDGRRGAWLRWDPATMRLSARRARPAPQPGDAALVDTRQYPCLEDSANEPHEPPRPVRVRAGGQWREAHHYRTVHAAGGRAVVQLLVAVDEDGWTVHYWRHYWWNPATVRPHGDSRAPDA